MWLWNLWRFLLKSVFSRYGRPSLEDFAREDDPVTTAFEIGCLILVVFIGMFALAMWIG
jgi:hypothetical protein